MKINQINKQRYLGNINKQQNIQFYQQFYLLDICDLFITYIFCDIRLCQVMVLSFRAQTIIAFIILGLTFYKTQSKQAIQILKEQRNNIRDQSLANKVIAEKYSNAQPYSKQEWNKEQLKQQGKQFKQAGKKIQIEQKSMSYDSFVDNYMRNNIEYKDPEVILYRVKILQANIKQINGHNKNPNMPYVKGLNQFAILTQQQFSNSYVGFQVRKAVTISSKSKVQIQFQLLESPNLAVNWQCYDSFAPDSGLCGSHYAFAALGSIYITSKIHGFQIQPLSIQQVISCSENNDKSTRKNMTCQTGSAEDVFNYVIQNGVGLQSIYPYNQKAKLSGRVQECKTNILKDNNYVKSKIYLKSFGKISRGDCSQIVYRLRFRALVVTVASKLLFLYKQGIIRTNQPLQNLQIDHEVILTSYDPQRRVYTIKNSWGRSWGNQGYADVTSSIGICQQGYFPVLTDEKPLPKPC